MGFFASASSIALGAVGWSWLSRAYYRVELGADETHFARSSDGWRIALSRYLPRGEAPRPVPLVCFHGLGANRFGWDLGSEKSFARWFSDQGFDVWVVELRGHGLSDRWGWRTGRTLSWNLDDHLHRDVAAALRCVREKTSAAQVDWVGHSMGGVLAYAALQTEGLRSQIRSAVVIGSSLAYHGSGSQFSVWQKLFGWARGRISGLPLKWFLSMSAPVATRFDNPLDRFNVWVENVEGRLHRRLLSQGFEWISVNLLIQLETAMHEEGLRSADGSIRYQDGVAGISVPVCVVGGDRDRQCPVAALLKTAEQLPEATRRIHVLRDYGHFDLLIGKRCEEDVFAVIRGFLLQESAEERSR